MFWIAEAALAALALTAVAIELGAATVRVMADELEQPLAEAPAPRLPER